MVPLVKALLLPATYRPHPRLLLTADELRALKRSERREVREALDAFLSSAKGLLGKARTSSYRRYFVPLPEPPQPPRHSEDRHWPYWTGLCAEISSDLQTCALAYALSGDERFLDRARRLMLALSRWEVWSDPDYGQPVCLDTWSLTSGVGIAYDLLYDRLSGRERATVRRALVEKGVARIYGFSRKEGSWANDPSRWPNGYAMVNAGMGIGALAVLGEHPEAERWVEWAASQARKFFDREIGRDGGLVEGLGYGDAALTPLCLFAHMLRKVTGEDLLSHPRLSAFVNFPLYNLAPGGRSAVNFCDAGGPSGATPGYAVPMALMALKDDRRALWYLHETGLIGRPWGVREVFRLVLLDLPKPPPPDDLPQSRHFRDIGWVALRTGWTKDSVLLAFKSGPFRSHSHLDQNSFVLNAFGEWLATDQGYQRYDIPYPKERSLSREKIHRQHIYTFTTVGHNSILVDGKWQRPVGGRVVAFFTSWPFDYTAGDASRCYEGLTRFVRRIAFVKQPPLALLLDGIESPEPHQYQWLLHLDRKGKFLLNGQEPRLGEPVPVRTVTAVKPGAMMDAHMLSPDGARAAWRIFEGAEEYGSYVELVPPKRERAVRFLVLLVPRRKSREGHWEPAVSARKVEGENALGAEVECEGGWRWLILLSLDERGLSRAAGVEFVGRCVALRLRGQKITALCGYECREVAYRGRVLLRASAPVSVGIERAEGKWQGAVEASNEATLSLGLPRARSLMLNGRPFRGVVGPGRHKVLAVEEGGGTSALSESSNF